MKRLMCILLIVLVLSTTVNTVQSEASVFLLCAGIGLTVKQVTVIATVIIASGVYLENWEEIDKAVYEFWTNASSKAKKIFTEANGLFQQAADGVINVTQEAWDCFSLWLDGLYGCNEKQILKAMEISTAYPKPMDLPKFDIEVYRDKGMKYEYVFAHKNVYDDGTYKWDYKIIFSATKLYIAKREGFYGYYLHSIGITTMYGLLCTADGEVLNAHKYTLEPRQRIHWIGNARNGVFERDTGYEYIHGYPLSLAPSPDFGLTNINVMEKDYAEQLQERLQAGGITIPLPGEEELPEVTTGGLLNDAGIDTDGDSDTGTGEIDGAFPIDDLIDKIKGGTLDIESLYNSVLERFNYNIFADTLKKMEKLKDAPKTPPKIYINLHKILDATKNMGDFDNVVEDKETIFIDFAILEEWKFQGMSVIEWFRKLVSMGMIITTFFHIKHVIMPQKAIKG
ncbi:hypothetical protein [Vallitalea guaymasensis]|uniref:hypothetical protein n=1 Tax=Vallitalea guaymasensis TaxID=1185412 RepID=UPI000DE2205B|nr:hypothetical protein [Vallitalea guaymasensis]